MARIKEIKRKSGSVWIVYNNSNKVVVITHDRNIAKNFIKLLRERK